MRAHFVYLKQKHIPFVVYFKVAVYNEMSNGGGVVGEEGPIIMEINYIIDKH